MWPHCRLKIAYCYGLRMWIFGQTPWTDTDQTFTIRTSLLTGHDADVGVGMTLGAGHPRSFPATAVVVSFSLNREDVSGQKTDQIMLHCVMLSCVLDGAVMRWRPVADWPSIGVFRRRPVTILLSWSGYPVNDRTYVMHFVSYFFACNALTCSRWLVTCTGVDDSDGIDAEVADSDSGSRTYRDKRHADRSVEGIWNWR